ncbi:Cysteine-rich receptor-like protein kinase 2 [Acorus gramineus]|uniref:Cysteine-rich receptor-like protein kinase 2 n=1 Tax=Acorus gramineus TaxID=55184 RepID=A0AAV9AWM8_ACOGR|nr:Cysteine-rich receptor-like protein kinase 2 [Acorus gramineus]
MGPFRGLALIVLLILTSSPSPTRSAEPGSNFVERRCGNRPFHHNATQASIYFTANMESLSNQVQSNGFGISSLGSGPDKTYALAQCYNYLSQVECVLCFSKLRTVGPLCFPNISGRVYLDGCFLRVDDYVFYKEALGPTDHAICGNTTRYGPAFVASVGKAVAAAVSKAEVNGGGYGEGRETSSAYAMASCLRKLDAGGCRECLSNASASARRCLPWSEGRVDNTGCFLRYSDTDFLSSDSKGRMTLKIVAIACSVAIVGLGSVVGVLLWKRNRIIRKRKKGMNKVSMKMASALSKSSLNFKYSTLAKATGTVEDLIDPNINGGHDMKPQILRTVHIAFLCTQENPSLRPSMSRALTMLLRITGEPLPTPTNPPFIDEETMELREVEGDSHDLLYETESAFVAILSHSTFNPRSLGLSLHHQDLAPFRYEFGGYPGILTGSMSTLDSLTDLYDFSEEDFN